MEKRREIVNCKRRCEDWRHHGEEKLQWRRGEKLLIVREDAKIEDVMKKKNYNGEEKRKESVNCKRKCED